MGVGYAALTVVTGTTIAKTWADGVRDSAVTQHASYAALTSAITSPSEGMVSYLTDNDVYWYYKNGGWRLLPGQYLYLKRDTSSTFFSGQAAGSFVTAFTSSTVTIPSSGTGQAFRINWKWPTGSGAFTTGRFTSMLQISVNGGAYVSVAKSGPVATNAVDTWPTQGMEIWKAGGSDTTLAMRIQCIAVGGVFDSIADANNPAILELVTTGMLTTEVA